MAIFYGLTRPNNPLTITPLENLPSRRPKKKPQFLDVMADGTVKQQGLGPARQEIVLSIKNLPAADKTSLYNYIENTIQWGKNSFDFDDDQGVEYSNCRLVTGKIANKQYKLNLYSDELHIIVEP
jgi:hypothetical protein